MIKNDEDDMLYIATLDFHNYGPLALKSMFLGELIFKMWVQIASE